MKQAPKAQFNPPTSTSSTIRRAATNAASILASDVTTRATTFVLYTLIARYLGTFEFGQMSLGLTLFQTFQLLAIGGLRVLVTREVAKDRTQTDKYLVNASAVIVLFALISVTVLGIFTKIMQYSTDTTTVIMLLSLGLLPYALSVICDALFQAWEQMYYITYANIIVNIGKVTLGFLLLYQGYSLHYIAWLLFFSHLAVLIVKWWLLLRYVTRPQISFDPQFSVKMMKSTITFFGIDGLLAIMSSFNVILLSKLTSEVEVGLFSAAAQIRVPMSLVFQSIIISVFPVMARSFEPSYRRLKMVSEQLIELLFTIALPTAIGLFFLAESVLLLLYGDQDFAMAAGALRVLVGALVLRVFTQVLGRVLVASSREKINFRILLIDLGVNIILAPILISQFGLMGAAMTALAVRLVDTVLHYIPVSRSFPGGIALLRITWKPILASAGMGIYLVAIQDQNMWLIIASAAVVYGALLFVLTVWSAGGPQQLKNRYLYLWSK